MAPHSFSRTATLPPVGRLYVDTVEFADGVGQIGSIRGNGLSIFYNPQLPENNYLGGRTYTLDGGGVLQPVPEPTVGWIVGLFAAGALTRRPRHRHGNSNSRPTASANAVSRLPALLLALAVVATDAAAAEPEGREGREAPPTSRPAVPRLTVREVSIGPVPEDRVTTMFPSPDLRHVAVVVKAGGKMAVLLDGAEQGRHDHVDRGNVVFSEDGKHLAYAAADRTRWFVVLDGVRQGREGGYVDVRPHTLRLSRRGERCAFVAKLDLRSVVVIDAHDTEAFDEVAAQGIVISRDGLHMAYAGKSEGKQTVVVDGRHTEVPLRCQPYISPGCDHVAYVHGDAPERMFLDGAPIDVFNTWPRNQMTFSPDGRHWAFVATHQTNKKGGSVVVVDGQVGEIYLKIDGQPRFSPDGRHVAYVAQPFDRERVVVMDGVEGKSYANLSDYMLFFSPDGKHFAYWRQPDFNSAVLVVDGTELKVDRWVAFTGFTDARTICGITSRPSKTDPRGREFVRVEVEIEDPSDPKDARHAARP